MPDSPAGRAQALFDQADWHAVEGATALCGRAVLDGRRAVVFATDPAHARGALGVRDGEALIWTMRTARAEGLPMVWLLDSAGAKVDEGLPALAAFRRFYREALDARAAGVPLIALLGRGCWGGASLLAMLADLRVFTPRTRFATSGPTIIESVEGKVRFDAADAAQVDALLGARARVQIDPGAMLAEETEQRALLRRWLSTAETQTVIMTGTGSASSDAGSMLSPAGTGTILSPAGLDSLSRTVGDDNESSPSCATTVGQRARLQRLLPATYTAAQRGNIAFALPAAGSGKAVFCGYLAGGAVGSAECQTLIGLLDEITVIHPRSAVILVLDAAGHAATVVDERTLLARHLCAVSQRIMTMRAAGHRVSLWIAGSASGAVYVVFAAPVDSVSVLSSARVEVLGAKAVDRILGRAVAGASSAHELVTLGVADGILDDRLNGYHAS